MKRRANGEGTIYKRKDGRWATGVYITLSDGSRKRKHIIGHVGGSYEEIRESLDKIKEQERKKIPFSAKKWSVGDWLEHWVTEIAPLKVRRQTVIDYELYIRLYLKPELEKKLLEELSVRDVQAMIDKLHSQNTGARTIYKLRTTLSSALSRAMREELIFRNVARLVEMPKYKPKPKTIWTAEQQIQFFETAKDHPWCLGFLEGFIYGMREGEVLGLRWCDIDFPNELISVRQQIQRLDGRLQALDLKTESSTRVLPLTNSIRQVLIEKAAAEGVDINNCFDPNAAYSTEGLILTSKTGNPIDPRNFARAFELLIKKAGLPRITFHTSRHIASTMHKKVGTPLCDAQSILGHADSDITRMIYQHSDLEVQRRALEATENMLNLGQNLPTPERCCQKLLSNCDIATNENDVKTGKDPSAENIKGSEPLLKWCTRQDSNLRPLAPQATLVYHEHPLPATVIKHIRAAMRAQVFGAVAVKTAVTLYNDDAVFERQTQEKLSQYLALLYACDDILKQKSKASLKLQKTL